MYSRDGPGRWAAGTAKSVRREGCMRWERCTHQLFPRGDNWHKSVLKPAAKGKMNVTLLSSCSPLGCCLGSLSPCVRADQGTMAYHHRVSTSPVSAWEVVLKSPWFWPGHLPQRTSHCPFGNTFGMVPPPTPRCGSLHHLPR